MHAGGIVLGLVDAHDQWAAKTEIGRGTFRKAVEVPSVGEYRIVIANDVPPRSDSTNKVEVAEVGLVGLDPAAVSVPDLVNAANGKLDRLFRFGRRVLQKILPFG